VSTKKKILIGAGIVIGVPLALIVVLVLVTAVYPSLTYRTNGAVVSSGEEREYLLYVPRDYDPAKPAPLVVSLHGAMNWPGFQQEISHRRAACAHRGARARDRGRTGTGPRIWDMRGWGNPGRMPDVRFIADLLDKLEKTYSIDKRRIYVNGLSNGGGMAFVLSCTLSSRIAAIGAVAAAQLLPFTWCKDATPVPMMAIHGDVDEIVPYNGGKVWIAPVAFPSVPQWVASWASRNRCSPAPVESQAARDVLRLEYKDCAGNAAVVLYTVQGGGHQWPGGRPVPAWLDLEMRLFGTPLGRRTESIDAAKELWAFFREHPLRRD
jgi:polyhydroxybutyrate depolymerase